MATDSGLSWPSAAAMARARTVLATRPRGLFSDVDGTLAPIAATPEAAVLLPGVTDLLRRAVKAFDLVAAVSGRAALDTQRMVSVPGVLYVGNHGLERLHVAAGTRQEADAPTVVPGAVPYVAVIDAALDQLKAQLAPRFPGIRFEPKGVTASIHVRGTDDANVAETAVYAAALATAAPRGLRVTRGKRVIELRPPLEIDKGVIVGELIAAYGLKAALYLGDDATDRDAFRALRRLTAEGACQGLAVAVLHPEAPARLAQEADIALASVEQVPAFLRWLVEQAEHGSVERAPS